MTELFFEKLYRYPREKEPCAVAVPFAQGALRTPEEVCVLQDSAPVRAQSRATSLWPDGSVRWLFTRFAADLPANAGCRLELTDSAEDRRSELPGGGLECRKLADGFAVDAGALRFRVKDNCGQVFAALSDGFRNYRPEEWQGPYLMDGDGCSYAPHFGVWELEESGPLCAVLKAEGRYLPSGAPEPFSAQMPSCSVKITAYYGKPWLELACSLINTTDQDLSVKEWRFALECAGCEAENKADNLHGSSAVAEKVSSVPAAISRFGAEPESGAAFQADADGVCRTTGTGALPQLEAALSDANVRVCTGLANYKTRFEAADGTHALRRQIGAEDILEEGIEHFAEVFAGTLFADRTDRVSGVCATVYQPWQNYPKAVEADADGLRVLLVPEDMPGVVFAPGMAREQGFQLHFHAPDTPLWELDNRSLIYQMPDRPVLAPSVYEAAGVMPDIFVKPEQMDADVEAALISKADEHTRGFGMLNWGDAPDPGYTSQGRGHGQPVWTNNEYDFPHACALLYARTGLRRFLDYMLVAGSHWKDVDVCHFSRNPLYQDGQWEHTHGHVREGSIVCSHEWVEGLLDCWHFTGDRAYLETALGIGRNVLRLLDTPAYQKSGELSARETGWALRTLTALYVETRDPAWVEKADWIVGQFQEWKEKFGHWLAPYTDNVMIRVPFMIAVAAGSLMRYYEVFPKPEVRELIVDAADDVIEHCLFDNGFFAYKELPSLNRLGNNPLVLEHLVYAYRLTGDAAYLKHGRKTYEMNLRNNFDYIRFDKRVYGDAVLLGDKGTKTFAQSFLPLALYYKALADAAF